MMTKSLIPALILTLLSTQATGQKIYWSSEKKLQWSDFIEANPLRITAPSEIFAVPWIGIELSHKATNDSIYFHVQAFFLKDKSWKRAGQPSHLLKHERLHFDIGEYVARLIRKELVTLNVDDLSTQITTIREKYKTKLDELQSSFDISTNHGNRRLTEKQWHVFIQYELYKLSVYQEPVVCPNPTPN